MRKIRLYPIRASVGDSFLIDERTATILIYDLGLEAIVDDEDFDRLNSWTWNAYRNKGYSSWYATRQTEDGFIISMHREIMGCTRGDRVRIDHCNRNTLDNRKSNLRECSPSQNSANSGLYRTNSTGYRGVYRKGNKWQAKICINRKTITLGTFDTSEAAAEAYDVAAIRAFGSFAYQNL